MAVFTDKKYQNNGYPKPCDEIDPELKTGSWISDRIQYYFNQYLAGNCGITQEDVAELELNRLYLDGKQPTAPYKDILTHDSTRANQHSVNDRKAFHNINYDSLMSPMPKFARKIEGMFLKQDHEITATAINEKAQNDRQTAQIKKYVANEFADMKRKIGAMMGVQDMGQELAKFDERSMEEIQILSNIGEYKLWYEIAGMKAIEITQTLSECKHIKRKVIRDLICGSITGKREVIDAVKLTHRYLNPSDIIVPFSENSHFNDMEYFCEQEYWTIRDLRKKDIFNSKSKDAELNEKKFRELAIRFHEYNYKDKAFSLYETYYPSTGAYGYDDHKIPVLYGAFISLDTKYEYKYKVAGEERIATGKYGVVKDNTLVSNSEKVYHGRWINCTEFHFDCGILNYMAFNEAGKVRLPAHIIKLDGTSIIENAKPILDQYALLGYRLQNAWANAKPSGYIYDWTMFENISSTSMGKLEPFDILKMISQTGDGVYRSKAIDSNAPSQGGAPMHKVDGGVGWTVLQEFITTEEMLDKKLISVTGIPEMETAGERTPVAVARMAIAAMSDVLKPLYDIYIENKERISYNSVYRIQIMIKHSKESRKFYTEQMGKSLIAALDAAYDNEPMSIGINFVAMPSEEMKQQVIAWATQATASGKNGTPILNPSELLYIIDNINSPSSLKSFRALLAYREAQDDAKAQQRQMAAIEAQGKAVQEQIAIGGAMKLAEAQGKGGLELNKIVVEKNLDLRNNLELAGNKQLADSYQKGVDYAMAQYTQQQAQGQNGQQPQPPPVPQPQQTQQ